MAPGKLLSRLALASALALCAAPAMAQSVSADSGLHGGQLEVPLNKSQVITSDRPIARAMIGNAEVADVFPISERSVYVLGKKLGTTSLTLYDRNNRVISVLDIAVGPDVFALRDQIGQLLAGEKVDVRTSNDSIVLSGLASDPGAARRIVQLAEAYAPGKVINMMTMGGSEQVMLEVKFSEVTRNSGKDIGVQHFGLSNDGTVDFAIGSGATLTPDADTGAGVLSVSSVTNSFGIIRGAFGAFGTNILSSLNALERKGLSRTLAEPTLVALSGEKASFLAGGEFPIPVAQSSGSGGGNGGGSAITVEFKPFGVGLSFTPTVLGDKMINLIVEPEVSSIDPSASVTVNGITVPGLQTRRASTTLELRDGESFAIAGLISKDISTSIRQVPLLGSIPILGALFRSTSFQKGETELLIIVTPRLVQAIRPDQVRLPTDRVKEPNEFETFMLGQPYATNPMPPAAPSPGAAAAPAPGATAAAPEAKKDDGYAY